MILDLGSGKQIVVSCDMGRMWIQIFANQGSLGVELSPAQAKSLGCELFNAGRRAAKRAGDTDPPR